MLKVFILLGTLTLISAKPGAIAGIGHLGLTGLAAPVGVASAVHSLPLATSSQSRHDIIHPGVITVQTAHTVPVITHAAPVAVAAPLSVSSAATSQLDVRTPAVAGVPVGYGHGALLGAGNGLGAGIGLGGGLGSGLGGGLGGGLGNGLGAGLGAGLGTGLGVSGSGYAHGGLLG